MEKSSIKRFPVTDSGADMKGDCLVSHELATRALRYLLESRLLEERMLLWLRKGHITKWFSGIGQEAISVGATLALRSDEYVFPMHRNLGVFLTRDVPVERLVAQFFGRPLGFTKGRDRSFHFGSQDFKIVGMISHLAAQLGVADGIGLSYRLRDEQRVALAFTGEGATSEGDFHEALNVAAVWDLPVIFIIENNGYALSTPVKEQYRCEHLSDRGKGYGMEAVTIDGNDFFTVFSTVSTYAHSLRDQPRPVLVECMTFRMRGHEEASGTKYVPQDLFHQWKQQDPVEKFIRSSVERGLLSNQEIESLRKETEEQLDRSLEKALAAKKLSVSVATELNDVYAVEQEGTKIEHSPGDLQEMRFVDAVRSGLEQGLEHNPDLILMGQDIAEYGGVFKVTEGFVQKYGPARIRNTPLCESAIIGCSLGLAIAGIPSVLEMQFSDFVSCGFNQIVNNLAKTHYRWGQKVPVVVRMPSGGGVAAGPFHSQTTEGWFVQVPGLKVVYPSTPYDAKGLLLAAIQDPNPVMFFEHKALYRRIKESVPEGYYTVELGRSKATRQGEQATVITYGMGIHWMNELLDRRPDLSIEVLDLRTLYPLDKEGIEHATKKTGRVLVLSEAPAFGGVAAEVAAFVGEELFSYLDAPVRRVGSLETPIPFAKSLEEQYLPITRLEGALDQLISF